MIDAKLQDGLIVASGDASEAIRLRSIPGASRKGKLPPGAWLLPLALESCVRLRELEARLSPELLEAAERMRRVQAYVEKQKAITGRPEPLAPMPLKDGITAYDHQVKAYNISLALLVYSNPIKEYRKDD